MRSESAAVAGGVEGEVERCETQGTFSERRGRSFFASLPSALSADDELEWWLV
jgi:hypothetical protein